MVSKTHFFEGAEKTLEMWFSSSVRRRDQDLRSIPRSEWDKLVHTVDAKIISEIENEDATAYMLSESSLFVFQNHVIIKTCGTTKCLQSLELMQKLAKFYCRLDVVDDVFYSRRNFLEPELQKSMHSSFDHEVAYLDRRIENGAPYIMGRYNKDCWHLYTKVDRKNEMKSPEQRFEVMMTGLNTSVLQQFWKEENNTGAETTRRMGIDKIIPGCQIDAFQFDPCGYSANALLAGGYYWTIHVTPEREFSYASFETNFPLSDYQNLLERVLSIFKPAHFNVVLMANQLSVADAVNRTRCGGFKLSQFRARDVAQTKYPSYDVHYSSYDVNSLADHC